MTYSLYYLFSLLALIISVTSYPFLGQVSDVKMDDLAQPQPQTCTEMSGKTVWTARAFHLRSEVKMLGTVINGGTGWLTFNLSNPAIGYELSCEGSSTKIPDFFTADQEFSCSGPSGDPDATANFRFDKPTGSFKISQVWFCNDNMSSRWSASGSTNVTLDCVDEIPIGGDDHDPNRLVGIDCGVVDIPVPPNHMEAVA